MAVTQDSTSTLKQRNVKASGSSEATAPTLVAQTGKTWGRAREIGILTIIGSYITVLFAPLFVVYMWVSCDKYQCEILGPASKLLTYDLSDSKSWIAFLTDDFFPKPTAEGFYLYFGWLFFQAALYVFVPAKIGYGQETPAGLILPYVVNGLRAWFITHALFIAGSIGLGLFPASIIHDNWGALLISANVYGFFLAFFSYVKANLFPSHPADRKFSSSFIYDFLMGIEFNPRIGKWFDFKLFHNGRPGIVAWTLINLSFAAAQYNNIGYVTNSMILVNLFHLIYVLDFFYNEDWYLRTIDICHDHFGFYLAWGDSVWLPFLYTLQSHYLVRHPVDLSLPYTGAVLAVGLAGYYIFRAVNHQKDIVRRTDGNCLIWGKPAKVIRTEFATSDGKTRKSLLLISGFWGLSRHFNYVGDLMISLAMCMSCGTGHILPYFYIFYMTFLLVQRIFRDQDRCQNKYGHYWDQYCKAVPYKLIPYIW
ncbi:ergosterol biosynthesis ERG4/ERG24 [Polychytrium aggregatum]|uniref:ergosterol biosynthesis ERG4/ERG24 n=1 Tax=Polychytrium aggregatum TaxID=110093 RepID=UPI0022FEBF2D|nr:ergosterol biosynthesis ERG4/ERG24 [Polychytrium aggregatum]KAI9202867.1 ergosterol biosynthesis ERG4/ERG24 [Polychytrium aggregatum]